MRRSKTIQFRDVAPILEKGACVLCSFLKGFQSSCIHGGDLRELRSLCSFHIWAVAGAADAHLAAEVFLQLLQSTPFPEAQPGTLGCDICQRIAREEVVRSDDFLRLLKDSQFRDWLSDYGALCLPHTARLLCRVTPGERRTILSLAREAEARLRYELSAVVGKRAPVTHRVSVLLSQAAEYLEGRRGLGRLQLRGQM